MLQRQLTYNSKPEDYIILSQRDQTSLKTPLKGRGEKWVKSFAFVLFSVKTSLLSKTSNQQLATNSARVTSWLRAKHKDHPTVKEALCIGVSEHS